MVFSPVVKWIGLFLVHAVFVAGEGCKRKTFPVALVEVHRHRFGFSDFADDDWFARPGIHQAALVVAPRLELEAANALGVFGGGNQIGTALYEV
jgi:hypothetical protein